MKKKKKKEKIVVSFNPSSRSVVTVDAKDLSYIDNAIREAGVKFAEEQDKYFMIILMGLIRKKLREDKTFANKLRDILNLDEEFRRIKIKRVVKYATKD